ncbi:leucine-rich repeat protein 1-like [Nylanderia fulva]|uniref:leucine-rich repeat protein 1-like n=1 Tax=Nylanderia fulva TaxID=613905 RepID=UPI0010FAD855|nr:leucine-rich repeat protein 1-like [Nylanderia fulva]
MLLHCNIEIYDRILSSRRKSQRSILTYAKVKNDVYFRLSTRSNKQGVHYKIKNNIRQVFTKFINNGKATISLIGPCHDLIIQSDAIQMKSFLNVLKHICKNCTMDGYCKDIDKYISSFTTFSSNQFFSLNKVVVKKKSEYPILQGFPKTTEQLFLSGLNRKSFDRQILTLQSLRLLDLSNNDISFLPKELGTLPHLQSLNLSHNKLGKSAQSKWTWLQQVALKNNLYILDISDNLLTELPLQIGQLKVLRELKIRNNNLIQLPQNIGTLNKLEFLDVAENNLEFLPAMIQYLTLSTIDLSGNLFCQDYAVQVNRKSTSDTLPSLVELSAKEVLKSRITYDASLIPYTLVQYLDKGKYCFSCKNVCFYYYSKIYSDFRQHEYTVKMLCPSNRLIKYKYYFCSIECYNKLYMLFFDFLGR